MNAGEAKTLDGRIGTWRIGEGVAGEGGRNGEREDTGGRGVAGVSGTSRWRGKAGRNLSRKERDGWGLAKAVRDGGHTRRGGGSGRA